MTTLKKKSALIGNLVDLISLFKNELILVKIR